VRLHFLGANRQVTGSRYLLEASDLKVMIDCGLFQERRFRDRNWSPPPIPPEEVDHLLLTHAHLDHRGLIPKFVKAGYSNPIHATPASIDVARLVLEDAAELQEEDAAQKKRRHEREGRRGPHPEAPLYTRQDAEESFRLLRIAPYGKSIPLNERVQVRYHDAGHILGSAMIEVIVHERGETRRVLFSGDVGTWNRPLMHNPSMIDNADFVIMESTYGDRDHVPGEDVTDALASVINDTVERGGNIVIPTFAIDRAQELMYHLGNLVRDDRIPRLTIFLDSPMAVDATTIYKRFRNLLDDATQAMYDRGEHPFQFAGMHFVRSARESRSINTIRGSSIIMAGSGMCTGGRVKHHLRHNIERPESTIVFVGYQAEDTLGRLIVDGEKEVRIHGRMHTVRAKVEQVLGLSAHGDRGDLLHWLDGFRKQPARLFLTHGEEKPAMALKGAVEDRLGWNVDVPEYEETVDLT